MFGGVAKTLYLCIVFFMVLDLRLTKIGTRRSPFFYFMAFSPSFTANDGIRIMYSFLCTGHDENSCFREDIRTLPEKIYLLCPGSISSLKS